MKPFKILTILLILLIVPYTSHGWSLKTHLWIGQQILNDILDDGKLNLLGEDYVIPDHILNALKLYPGYFLMGNLGPDIFPDPISGQTTVHPGIKNGWATDQWLDHVLYNATDPKDIAFAYGIASHAAADIFAHTYVNQYAGDIFHLTDGERDVELRHFVLEKYIESHTPNLTDINGNIIDIHSVLNTPEKFISNSFILNYEASRQNSKVGTTTHLFAMYEVFNAVENLENMSDDVISSITDFAAKHLKKVADISIDLATAKITIDVAQEAVRAHKNVIENKKRILLEAERAKESALEIIRKNPELIASQTKLLELQVKKTSQAVATSLAVAKNASDQMFRLNREVSRWMGDLGGLVCEGATKLLGWICPDCVKCADLRKNITNANNQISMFKLQVKYAEEAVELEKKIERELLISIDKLEKNYLEAINGITENTFDIAINSAKLSLELEGKYLDESMKILSDAERLQKELKEELNILNVLIDEVNKFIKKYNIIKLLIKNWKDDIKNATEEYAIASHAASKLIINNSGNPLNEYWKWQKCYGQVFMATPQEIGEGVCLIENHVNKLKDSYSEIINSLPKPLRWLVDPTGQMSALVLKEIEPQLEKAKKEILEFLTDATTAEFLLLLSNPENITKEKLNNVYSKDNSGKYLLIFKDVSKFIDQDLGIIDGTFNPKTFIPIKNSITLAKLSLMGPESLNLLIKSRIGETQSPYFGQNVFSSTKNNFCLLIDAVKNIDGNHQWQAYGLPYPRRFGKKHCGPNCSQFGHDFYKDNTKGFKLYVDPYLREKVFIPLFEGSMQGSLANRDELKLPNYNFPECWQNPFPTTQDNSGNILKIDDRCNLMPKSENIISFDFKSPDEFKSLFFQTEQAVVGSRHWTIVGSFDSEKKAKKHRDTILKHNPDIYCEVGKPGNKENIQWTVLLAAGTTEEKAIFSRILASRRNIVRDPYILKIQSPFDPIE